MIENQPRRKLEASIPGCCDPKRPFNAIPPTDCSTCQKQGADFKYWDCLNEYDLYIEEIRLFQSRQRKP